MVITKKEWDFILKQESGRHFKVKVDFGLRQVSVCIDCENIRFEDGNVISAKEKIKDNFCYLINDNKIDPISSAKNNFVPPISSSEGFFFVGSSSCFIFFQLFFLITLNQNKGIISIRNAKIKSTIIKENEFHYLKDLLENKKKKFLASFFHVPA